MGLNPGNLDREIILQTAEVIQSDSGEEVFDWDHADEQTIWAEWLPADTREAWQAGQRLGAYVDGVFRVYDLETRPQPDNTRILFDGRIFDLKPWIEIGRGEGLMLPVVARGV